MQVWLQMLHLLSTDNLEDGGLVEPSCQCLLSLHPTYWHRSNVLTSLLMVRPTYCSHIANNLHQPMTSSHPLASLSSLSICTVTWQKEETVYLYNTMQNRPTTLLPLVIGELHRTNSGKYTYCTFLQNLLHWWEGARWNGKAASLSGSPLWISLGWVVLICGEMFGVAACVNLHKSLAVSLTVVKCISCHNCHFTCVERASTCTRHAYRNSLIIIKVRSMRDMP